MKIEDQVASVEPAKELKGLGVKQDSLWFWIQQGEYIDDWSESFLESKKERDAYYDSTLDGDCSAYTVAELGEKLPLFFSSYHTEYDGWQCDSPSGFNDRYVVDGQKYHVNELVSSMCPRRLVQEAQTEADARAKMLIYLIKEEFIKAEDIK